MKSKEIPKVHETDEHRTDLDTVFFQGQEFDLISHFYPESDRFRVKIRAHLKTEDGWQRDQFTEELGWCVGYRDWVPSKIQYDQGPRLGFGGEVYVIFDRTGDMFGLDPKWVTPIWFPESS